MQNTLNHYDNIIADCKSLFKKKLVDYGSAWRILRLPSLTDQIFIKAQRIRSIQLNEIQKVDEGQADEFIGISSLSSSINFSETSSGNKSGSGKYL